MARDPCWLDVTIPAGANITAAPALVITVRRVLSNLYFVNPAANSLDVHLLHAAIDGPPPTPVDGGTAPPGAEEVVKTDNYDTYGVVVDATSPYWDEDNQVMKAPQAAAAKVRRPRPTAGSGRLLGRSTDLARAAEDG